MKSPLDRKAIFNTKILLLAAFISTIGSAAYGCMMVGPSPSDSFCSMVSALALLFVGAVSLAEEKGKEGSWTGWITDTHCGAKGNNAKHPDCATKCVEQTNAKSALYTPEGKKI